MVVLFAQCEADLLALVAELCGGGDDAEIDAVRLLKDAEKAKDRITELVRGLGLSGLTSMSLSVASTCFAANRAPLHGSRDQDSNSFPHASQK